MKLTKAHLEEIVKCKNDFLHFCRYLQIIDKQGIQRPFKPNPAQLKVYSELQGNNWLSILKARQLGSSTFIAAYYLHKALFYKNHRVAVAAHTLEAVRAIFQIYTTYYNTLPKFLQLPTDNQNANELRFKHGSRIKVGTPNSFRGSTYQSLHASEVAYWKDPEQDIAALFQTMGANPTVILETTANGLNEYHRLWNSDNGYTKLFLSWQLDPGYTRGTKQKDITITERELIEGIKGITQEQKNWAIHTLRTKCAGSLSTFKQEYASDPITCFISSGTRVFDFTFPDATVTEGFIEYEKPSTQRPYIMGVDAAEGGKDGDYSAFTILTREDNPRIVATYYGRIESHSFAEVVHKYAKQYNAFIVVEAASTGYAILDYLKRNEYPHLYRRMVKDKATSELTEKLGFNTNVKTRSQLIAGLHELINVKKLTLVDERLQVELNTFVYLNGKAIHDRNRHDDMIFSLALAWIGYEQADYIRVEKKQKKPVSMTEVLEWEATHKQLYSDYQKGDVDHFISINDAIY